MTNPLIYYSRSAVVSDWVCPRKRYWNYEYAGRGINPMASPLALQMGILIHDGLAAITANIDIDTIADAANAQLKGMLLEGQDFPSTENIHFAEEQAALVEGLLRGYHRHIWPQLQEDYEVVACEKEMIYEHDGLHFLSKPDLLLRNKESGDLIYVEFKSTSSVKEQWMASWQTAVQLHSSIKAVEATLGETVSQVIVQGLNKGYVSQYNRQESILIYGYFKAGQPPFQKDTWSYVYRAGLKKEPIWKREGGVKQWIAEMPENILSQQLPITPPIFINRDLVDAFFRQRAVREHDIRLARDWLLEHPDDKDMIDRFFPQHFEQCTPGWGTGCSYRKLCHGNIQEPLAAGYELRHSHHQLEEDQLNDQA